MLMADALMLLIVLKKKVIVKCLQAYSKTTKISIYKIESYLITSRTWCSGYNSKFGNTQPGFDCHK